MAAIGAAAAMTFQPARREVEGVTAAAERRALAALCARMPTWVQPDHLTALGLLGTVLAGVGYGLVRVDPAWLHVVNAGLLLNWFGDSLDGTLARYRRQERPRYGFYVDHVIDAVGALFVIGGLGLSGLMSPAVGAGLLIAYLLMAIHVYLATYCAGTFKISYGAIGGTELRILLALANLAALAWPVTPFASLRLFDLIGGGATLALAVLFVLSTVRTGLALRRQETRRPG